jgi:hypothetical protein
MAPVATAQLKYRFGSLRESAGRLFESAMCALRALRQATIL